MIGPYEIGRIHRGDVMGCLARLPDESVHCVVTSPPYWGLRSYTDENGAALEGQWGLEATPEEHVARIVAWGREVRRVLRSDGTLWLNYGDSYVGSGCGGASPETSTLQGGLESQNASKVGQGDCPARGSRKRGRSPKPKDLVGMPWRVALALQADGWWLRSDVIWHKPNPMPESVTDRPTSSHEHIFLLTKAARYFYDAEAVKEAVTGNAHARGNGVNPKAKAVPAGWETAKGSHNGRTGRYGAKAAGANSRIHRDRDVEHASRPKVKQRAEFSAAVSGLVSSRNSRDVWTIATQAYAGAHYATFPEAIPERCIKAGTSERGVCPTCGAPWRRVVEETQEYLAAKTAGRKRLGPDYAMKRKGMNAVKGEGTGGNPKSLPPKNRTVGWRPTCECWRAWARDRVPCEMDVTGTELTATLDDFEKEHEPVPATVLDPFAGSGTTGVVAARLGRAFIGFDLTGGDKDLGGHTANQRIAAAERGLSLSEHQVGQQTLADATETSLF